MIFKAVVNKYAFNLVDQRFCDTHKMRMEEENEVHRFLLDSNDLGAAEQKICQGTPTPYYFLLSTHGKLEGNTDKHQKLIRAKG